MIPKTFHHIYWDFSGEGKPMPEKWSTNLQGFKDHHPDWKFVLWDLGMCEKLLRDNFPNYLELWKSFLEIQKCDFARYMMLFVYGGVYTDLDCICHQPIDEWIEGYSLIFPKIDNPYFGMLNNYLLCSEKGNKFWLKLMKRSKRTMCPTIVPKYLRIPYTTGPMAVTLEYNNGKYKANLVIPDEYIEHQSEVSWIEGPSKSKVFNFCGFILMLIIVAIFLAMFFIIAMSK